MSLGIAQIGALIVYEIINQIVKGEKKDTAMSAVAARFDYFRKIEDTELAAVAMELGNRYPEIPWNTWYYQLKQLKAYGVYLPGEGPEILPGPETPGQGDKSGINTYIYIAIAVLLIGVVVIH